MLLNDLCTLDQFKQIKKLSESLSRDFNIDISIYADLTEAELVNFIGDLKRKKEHVILETEFNSYYSDPEYTKLTLLSEALYIILKEIHPKRKPKKKSVSESAEELTNETLDYKVHEPTGVVVDHDIDEDSERPDLYWRKHQWEDERTQENHPVEVIDAPLAGEAYSDNWEENNPTPEVCDTMDAYAQNQQPVGGTHENEQQAGVYVAVMNPDRFLGDKETNIMSIEPTVNSQNEISPLSRKISRVMVDAGEEYSEEGNEPMTNTESMIKGLSDLLNNSLLKESELQRAEIVFATNDLVGRLGKMIEDLSKMGTDDIMPLVDGLRSNYGSDVAEAFSQQSEQNIQGAADGISAMKQHLDVYREKFESRISDEDAETPLDLSGGGEASSDDLGLGGEEGGDDLGLGDEGGDDLGLGGEEGGDEGGLGDLGGGSGGEEPLGRVKKEIAEMAVIDVAGKRVRLTMEQIAIIHKAKKLTEKIKSLGDAIEDTNPQTLFLDIQGKKIKVTEQQIKALIFAKNFKKRVDEKKANTVRLSENQAIMLARAKTVTQKINKFLNETK